MAQWEALAHLWTCFPLCENLKKITQEWVGTGGHNLTVTIFLNYCAFLLGHWNLDSGKAAQSLSGLDAWRSGERRLWFQTHLGLDPASITSWLCDLGISA